MSLPPTRSNLANKKYIGRDIWTHHWRRLYKRHLLTDFQSSITWKRTLYCLWVKLTDCSTRVNYNVSKHFDLIQKRLYKFLFSIIIMIRKNWNGWLVYHNNINGKVRACVCKHCSHSRTWAACSQCISIIQLVHNVSAARFVAGALSNVQLNITSSSISFTKLLCFESWKWWPGQFSLLFLH